MRGKKAWRSRGNPKQKSSTRKITIADESVTTVAGQGNVCLNNHIILKDVLHVPKLCTNLISVHKLTVDSQCSANFHPTHCVFQEQSTKRMIGHAKEQNCLYYLETGNKGCSVQSCSPHSFHSLCPKTHKDKIWLYDLRVGHPSFHTLKVRFPDLFRQLAIEDFHCETPPLTDQSIFEYSPFPELPVVCPRIQDTALQPQQIDDPPQILLGPDPNLQPNQTLDSARPLQVYSRRKVPPPTSEPVQSSSSELQDVKLNNPSNPHLMIMIFLLLKERVKDLALIIPYLLFLTLRTCPLTTKRS
ncbi:Retrovirus-related Pol polyprotein from transposon TNT 1-94 [Senna tora]|uniref:Retrovirus-related Pol polyprotein from transposon TNT 1-94 n=1 Tax=Senna tora TaxID=362788 RepID=A0A834W3N6_9FABA|nr:Retrovirus-related Pol polyprotein from transposon TNT 1-94 [Senna tora]